MADEKVTPATPEEYRAMLDRLNLFSRPAGRGFHVTNGVRDFIVTRDSHDWWEIVDMDGCSQFVSAWASKATETFIMRIYLR